MPQEQTTVPTKSDTPPNNTIHDRIDQINNLNDTINKNSTDLESRMKLIEDTDTSNINTLDWNDLVTKSDGTIVYESSMEIPIYSNGESWYRCSDEAPLNGLTEVDLFIVMGQSNADGKAQFVNLDSQTGRSLEGLSRTGTQIHLSTIDQTSREYIEGAWEQYNPGVNASAASDRFGPELGFSDSIKAIVDAGGDATYSKPVSILKFAKGSTSLGGNWASPNGDCYTAMIEDIPNAKFDLGQVNYKFNIRGMVWYQGESDSSDQTYASNYESNLTSFISDVRSRFNKPSLPVVLCKIGYTSGNEPTYYTQVRDALQAVSDSDSNISIIDTMSYDRRDSVHLNAKGMYELGEAIVPLMTNLL